VVGFFGENRESQTNTQKIIDPSTPQKRRFRKNRMPNGKTEDIVRTDVDWEGGGGGGVGMGWKMP